MDVKKSVEFQRDTTTDENFTNNGKRTEKQNNGQGTKELVAI